MNILIDILVILGIILIISSVIIYLRRKLLTLWKEVSVKEVVFYKLLRETVNVFYEHKDLFKDTENSDLVKRLKRYRHARLRHLMLKERQDLFLALSYLYNDIEDEYGSRYMTIHKQFKKLQQARRVYNSKVLLYNQSISVFPTRFLAIKMNLKIKEYFG